MCKTFWENLDEHSQNRLLAEGEHPLIGQSAITRSDNECDQLLFWYEYSLGGAHVIQCPHFRIVRIGIFESSFKS
jgi:hypothetical protein